MIEVCSRFCKPGQLGNLAVIWGALPFLRWAQFDRECLAALAQRLHSNLKQWLANLNAT